MSVSIVVATHGGEEWGELALERAYPSAQRQGALEVVVNHLPDGTLAGARNAAAEEAAGDWLCFLDADDQLCPGYLDAMAVALEDWGDWPLAIPLLAPAVLYCERGAPLAPPAIPNAGKWPDTNECVIGTLVERALFLEVGGFRELPSLEDYDLWLRCWAAGATIVHVPAAIYVAHVNSAGRNADQSVYWQLREEHADLFA